MVNRHLLFHLVEALQPQLHLLLWGNQTRQFFSARDWIGRAGTEKDHSEGKTEYET